ncbi:hypothetical protein LB516_11635 [Mesorhizobium sp. CO1-1-7]|uniref:hypothetical protein n=1 Tax=Mesorhizobium sp. CO1-1-7 TaxID=2876632 RepID=UPI001CD18A87|nr:hypothetical protein [Mesorhizobium sp. CO1-1-7]MBZ9745898.1 hypothetical protein [Mesorhizobium sp. CO1-1-7]
MNLRRSWEGVEWQNYSLRLVQLRHGSSNVQIVPDKVHGDAGIEFFSMDGCCYQCYAPEEVVSVAKASSSMKAKGRRDLSKLKKNKAALCGILQNIKIRRWILICPFLDDKSVIAAIRTRGEELKGALHGLVTDDFEALVQSQDDFIQEIENIRKQSFPELLEIPTPTVDEVVARDGGPMAATLERKLRNAYKLIPREELLKRKTEYIVANITRENALQYLKSEHPILWERATKALTAEERRLVMLGSSQSAPREQLVESLGRITEGLRNDLPDLATSSVTQISLGTLADWLLRCPLDFE